MIYFKNLGEEYIERICDVVGADLLYFSQENRYVIEIYFKVAPRIEIFFNSLEKAQELIKEIYSCVKRKYGVIDFEQYREKEGC